MPRLYKEKPSQDRTLVVLVEDTKTGAGTALSLHLKACGERYGFDVETQPELPASPHLDRDIYHIIYCIDGPYHADRVAALLAAIGTYGTASIALRYQSWEHARSFEEDIEAMKAASSDRINFLMPDSEDLGGIYVSSQKILDNAVCDTVRVKYVPKRVSGHIAVPSEVASYFRACSRLFEEHHLYLRAPTDGYFAMKVRDGFFITATKTKKTDLDIDRISFVHEYDRENNQLAYSGAYLPSSDSVEAAVLLDQLPEISVLMHTHASKQFTRNPHFADRAIVPALPYGEPTLGIEVAKALSRLRDGFVIMREHGEIFADSGDGMDQLFKRLESWLAVSGQRAKQANAAE